MPCAWFVHFRTTIGSLNLIPPPAIWPLPVTDDDFDFSDGLGFEMPSGLQEAYIAHLCSTAHERLMKNYYLPLRNEPLMPLAAAIEPIDTDEVGPLERLQSPDIPPMQPDSQTAVELHKLANSLAGFPNDLQQRFLRIAKRLDTIWNAGERPLSVTNLIEFTVDVHPDTKPIKCNPRSMPPEKHRRLIKLLTIYEKQGIIVKRWSQLASPLVMVIKQTGEDRICTDLRRLNQVTRVSRYPKPNIQQALSTLRGKKYFSVFDFTSAYWQIPVAHKSRPLLAFITTEGIYQWQRMPFGAVGAPYTQQLLVDHILGNLKWKCAIAYLDDIIIFSDTLEEHLEHIAAFLERVAAARLQLKPQKCRLFAKEIRYLGFLVSAEGVRPDPRKIQALQKFPQPRNLTELRRFVRMTNFYRRFIRNFARIVASISKLLRNEVPWQWANEQQKAFETLKKALMEATLMRHPLPGKPFFIDCDASNTGLGAV